MIQDLLANHKTGRKLAYVNSEKGYPDKEYTVPEFLASMVFDDRPIAVLNIFLTEKGLQKLGLKFEVPFRAPTKVLKDDSSTTFTPKGHVTYPHEDPFAAMNVFYHLSGRKLWITWPPTPFNLEKVWTKRTDTNMLDIEFWVEELEGMEALLVEEEGSSFSAPPFTIHACLSVTKSAHTGGYVLNGDCLDHMKNHAEVIKATGIRGIDTVNQFRVQALVEDYENTQFNAWKDLKKRLLPEEKAKVTEWRDIMTDFINANQDRLNMLS